MDKKAKKFIKSGYLLLSISAFLISCASSTLIKNNQEHQFHRVASEGQQLEIHTLSLNNKAHGDCTIVKFGNTEVLIDAGGSLLNSAALINNALDKYVEDGVLEYAIVTHKDDDHVSNFTINGGVGKWLFEEGHAINILIDFDISLDESIQVYPDINSITNKNSYIDYRNIQKNKNKIRHHLVSSMCTYQKRGGIDKEMLQNWAKIARLSKTEYITDTYPLFYNPENPDLSGKPINDVFSMEDTGCRLKILYNYFYDHPIDDNAIASSADFNVISVCAMVELDTNEGDPIRALFTGDLEEYDSSDKKYNRIKAKGEETAGGESLLYKYNKEELSTPITYYKAAHHCSDTSNSPYFLEKIRPQNVVIPACAGGEHDFPNSSLDKGERVALGPISELSNYTDHIYITDQYFYDEDTETGKVIPYYGDINFYADSKGGQKFVFTNPQMDDSEIDISKSLFFTDWMKKNRIYNVRTFNLTNSSSVAVNCTYIKIGSIDILIGAGCEKNFIDYASKEIAQKVDYLCNDHILDYLIIPTPYISDWQYISGKNPKATYILQNTAIKKVTNFVYYNSNSLSTEYQDFIERMNEGKKEGIIDNCIPADKIQKDIVVNKQKKYGMYLKFDNIIHDDYYIEFLCHKDNAIVTDETVLGKDASAASIYTLVRCGSYRYLNIGNDFKFGYSEKENFLISNNPEIVKNIHILQIPHFGWNNSNPSSITLLKKFYEEVGTNKGGHPNDGSDKTKITRYLFLNTYYGESDGKAMKHPICGEEYASNHFMGAVFTTKGRDVEKNKPFAIRGDICAQIGMLEDLIYLYRFKKTGSLSFDDFSFYNKDAVRRSEAGNNHKCDPLNTDDVNKCKQ